MRTARRQASIPALLLALCLALACVARAGDGAPGGEEPGLQLLPTVVHRVAPEYPDSLLQAGVRGPVTVRVLITATGSVGDVQVSAGPAALAPYAVAAVRQWRFTPDQTSGKPAPCWVTIPVAFAAGAGERPARDPAVAEWPVALVSVPLVTPDDGVDPAGPPFLGVVRFDIGTDGFVRAATFEGPAPPQAPAILARARRWIWTPARDARGNPVATWTSFRVSARPGAVEVARPDSVLGRVLEVANYANVKVLDRAGKGVQRDMDPLAMAHVFAEWLSDPKAYTGPDPWRSRCAVRFDARMEFDGPAGILRADFARGCGWMQVTTRDRVLFVPYGPIHARIDTALARIFPDVAFEPR